MKSEARIVFPGQLASQCEREEYAIAPRRVYDPSHIETRCWQSSFAQRVGNRRATGLLPNSKESQGLFRSRIQSEIQLQNINARFAQQAKGAPLCVLPDEFIQLVLGKPACFGNTGRLKIGVVGSDIRIQTQTRRSSPHRSALDGPASRPRVCRCRPACAARAWYWTARGSILLMKSRHIHFQPPMGADGSIDPK